MAALPRFLVLGMAGSLSGSLRGSRFWFGSRCVVICRGFASLCWCSPVDWLRQWLWSGVVSVLSVVWWIFLLFGAGFEVVVWVALWVVWRCCRGGGFWCCVVVVMLCWRGVFARGVVLVGVRWFWFSLILG
jgi:hypothetical protein